MKQILKNLERSRLDERIKEAEKKTGAQIVLAVIERSDSYPEIPWKAFALAVPVAGFFVFLHAMLWSDWPTGTTVLLALAATLTAGLVCALMTVYLTRFARLFLNAHHKEVKVRQYAESLFLSHELFSTRKRSGILLLVSMFERQVIILPDRGIQKRLSEEALRGIISSMKPSLASGQIAGALEKGLERLEEILVDTATGEAGKNELPDEIIEERGS